MPLRKGKSKKVISDGAEITFSTLAEITKSDAKQFCDEVETGIIDAVNKKYTWHKFSADDKRTWPPTQKNSLHPVSEEVLITDGHGKKIGYLHYGKIEFYIQNGNNWNSSIYPIVKTYNEIQKLFGFVEKQRRITHWMLLPEFPNDTNDT